MDERRENKQSAQKQLLGHREDNSKTGLSFSVPLLRWETADGAQEDFFNILLNACRTLLL